jgi:hypothetical protein
LCSRVVRRTVEVVPKEGGNAVLEFGVVCYDLRAVSDLHLPPKAVHNQELSISVIIKEAMTLLGRSV